MTNKPRTLLMAVPLSWAPLWTKPLAEMAPHLKCVLHGKDAYTPGDVDYVLSFRPETGLLKTLTNNRAVFSLGAGVDGFFVDPDYPRAVPLVRFVDPTLSREMAQYVVMHTLIYHRQMHGFEVAQAEKKWRQSVPPRRTEDTHIGIMGLGEIGTMTGLRLRDLGFDVASWSRSRKAVDGIKSFAGDNEREAFLNHSDILVCLLPLTPQTRGILNAKTFAQLPKGAFIINVARGGHLIEDDLIAAIDSGHLDGATLDVFQTEPLPEASPLWHHPKITVTPHISAISDPRVAVQTVVDGIAAMERGELPRNVVDFDKGY